MNQKRALVMIWGLGLIVSSLAAWNSAGVAHYDEHFQILEFLNYKLGNISADRLPWEFAARMRPWFQPTLYFGIAKSVTIALGKWDPFAVATACRMFSAWLGWLSLFLLWRRYSRDSIASAAALCFFGFLPFLHARTSGENLSGSFLALALSVLPEGEGTLLTAFGAGALLGLSFEARYQIAFAIVGIVAWLIVISKASWRWILAGLSGFALVLLMSLGIDRWGYGEWCFPPWNYFRENVLLGKANGWGTEPVWFYLRAYLREPPFGLGFIVLLGWAMSWILVPWSVISWASFSFFAAHSLTGHKEPRFLYPIVQFGILGLFLGWKQIQGSAGVARWSRKSIVRMLFWIVTSAVLLLNAILLLRTSFFPFSTGLALMEEVYRRSAADNVILYQYEDPSLFYQFEQDFYTPEKLTRIRVEEPAPVWEQRVPSLTNSGKRVFFYTRQTREKDQELQSLLHRCVLVRSLGDDANLTPWLSQVEVRSLYECH